MRKRTGIILALCVGASSSAWAQEGQPAGQPVQPAESPAQLYQRIDEMKVKLAALEKQLQSAATADEIKALKDEFAALKAELGRMSNDAQKLDERLKAAEGQLAPQGATPEGFEVDVRGFVRVGYDAVEDNEEQTSFVGLNDGFVLGNARLSVDGQFKKDIHFRVQLDGAVDQRDSFNTSSGELTTRVRDAFMEYRAESWLVARLGQFKPPFDAEEKRSTVELLFPSRAVESVGVNGVEGNNVRGLSVDRDTGLMLYSDPISFGGSGLGAGYFLAVVNGSGSVQPRNDNDEVAGFGRLELYFSPQAQDPAGAPGSAPDSAPVLASGAVSLPSNPDAAVPGDTQERMVTLGVGAFYNKRTTGRAPDLLNEQRLGLAADLELRIAGVVVQGQFIQWEVEPLDVDADAARTARGFHVALGYEAPLGLTPAYRFASHDPTAAFSEVDPTVTQQLDADELTYHTIGLGWSVPGMPLLLQAAYTITLEDELRALDNNRLELVGQVVF